MKYESCILKRLFDTYGVIGNPRYLSEIIKEFIVRGKELYPQLFTYQSDWLAHIDEFGLTPEYTVSYTGQHIYAPNTKEKPVKSAILKGSTKYRDIDTGEFLETFEEGRNLELVSVKMPVLTTSNEDGTKTNILTVTEDMTLRGIGEIRDTLDLMTGEVVQNVGEMVLDGGENYLVHTTGDEFMRFKLTMGYSDVKRWGKSVSNNFAYNRQMLGSSNDLEICNGDGAHEVFLFNIHKSRLSTNDVTGFKNWLSQNNTIIHYELSNNTVKTVDLTIHDKDHQKVERLTTFEGGTHFTTSSQDGSLLPTLTVDVVTDLEETLVVCSLEGNTM